MAPFKKPIKNQEDEEQELSRTTIVNSRRNLRDLDNHIYTPQEIEQFRLDEAINSHPLTHRPTNIRSKLAYAEIMKNLKPTSKYLLPGQLVLFEYLEPKFKEDLEYYDRTPFTLFFGITRTDDGNIREIGINLHYYSLYIRVRIINKKLHVFN